MPIKDSADRLGMNYSTAKSILCLHKKTGRIERIDRPPEELHSTYAPPPM